MFPLLWEKSTKIFQKFNELSPDVGFHSYGTRVVSFTLVHGLELNSELKVEHTKIWRKWSSWDLLYISKIGWVARDRSYRRVDSKIKKDPLENMWGRFFQQCSLMFLKIASIFHACIIAFLNYHWSTTTASIIHIIVVTSAVKVILVYGASAIFTRTNIWYLFQIIYTNSPTLSSWVLKWIVFVKKLIETLKCKSTIFNFLSSSPRQK